MVLKVVFGWRALRPPRVVFVLGSVSLINSPTSGKISGEEKRAQLQAMQLEDLVRWWDETREVREAAREAVVVAAHGLSW